MFIYTLNKEYLSKVREPDVDISVMKYRPVEIYIEGEVEETGLHVLPGSSSLNVYKNNRFSISDRVGKSIFNMNSPQNLDFLGLTSTNSTNSVISENVFFPTVFDAIRASGGITKFSDLSNIQIIRNETISNGSGKKTTTLNFEKLLLSGDNSVNIRIYDSDIIKIKRTNKSNNYFLTKAILSKLNPKFINVFVTGRVNRPGSQTVSRASVLSDAVDMAGGAKFLRGPVTFIRFNADGTIDKRKIRLTKNRRGQFNNPNLRDGDFILVGNNALTTANEVIGEFTSPFFGIFSTYGLIKAISN